MKWYRLSLFKITLLSFAILACNKDFSETGPATAAEDRVDILIAGAVSTDAGQGEMSACYWVNDSLHILDDYSVANDAVYLDDQVIAAGKYQGKPCFWKGGKRTVLDEAHLGEVKAVGLNGGDIYLVGESYEGQGNVRAFMWKAGKMTFLNNYKGTATDIVFKGNDIYISGMDSERPCYWKNGTRFFLSEDVGYSYGVAFSGNDVLVGGGYRAAHEEHSLMGYWKNGTFQSPAGNSCYVWGIGINREKVFLVGATRASDHSDDAVLIVDDQVVALSAPQGTWSGANGISFDHDDQYVLGAISDPSVENHHSRVCYWLNGKLHEVCKQKSIGVSIYLRPAI